MQSETTNEKYFAGANTAKGFVSYYGEIFGHLCRRYVIKGGPGTGKSRLMRDIASAAAQRGIAAELFYCSSDPSSLDGIVLPSLSVGLLDGTPPHAVDPVYPGVQDEIVNLGAYWHAELLREHADEIRAFDDEKKRRYVQTYHYLCAAEQVASQCRSLAYNAVLKDKLHRAAERSLRSVKAGDGCVRKVRVRSGITMRGSVTFDTYRRIAKRTFILRDRSDTAQLYLRALCDILRERRQPYTVSLSPLDPSVPDAVYVPADGSAYIAEATVPDDLKAEDSVINMDRFLDADAIRAVRAKLRFGRKLYDALTDGAYTELREISQLHFMQEDIYASAMDFVRKEEMTRKLTDEIFG